MTGKSKTSRKLAFKLVVVAVAMFAVGVFAMPSLYTRFCQITGFGQQAIQIADHVPDGQHSTREVTVRFDATTNSALNWAFRPVQKSMKVTLGKAAKAFFYAENLDDSTETGRAVYNVNPGEASKYFVKTECFCFTNQQFKSHESRKMPVVFYIKEDLPKDIQDVTLSYTFFKIANSTAAKQKAP